MKDENKKNLINIIYDEMMSYENAIDILKVKNDMIYEILLHSDIILEIKGVSLEDDREF